MVRRRCARYSELRWARGRPDESGRGACLETLAGVGRLGHEKLLGPAVSAPFQPPPLAQRIPRTPVAASVDTPRATTSASSGGFGASSTHPGFPAGGAGVNGG